MEGNNIPWRTTDEVAADPNIPIGKAWLVRERLRKMRGEPNCSPDFYRVGVAFCTGRTNYSAGSKNNSFLDQIEKPPAAGPEARADVLRDNTNLT